MVYYELIYTWISGSEPDGYPMMSNDLILRSEDKDFILNFIETHYIKLTDPEDTSSPTYPYVEGFMLQEHIFETYIYKPKNLKKHMRG